MFTSTIDFDKYESFETYGKGSLLQSPKLKEPIRQKLAKDVEAFLAAGGKIDIIPIRRFEDVKTEISNKFKSEKQTELEDEEESMEDASAI